MHSFIQLVTLMNIRNLKYILAACLLLCVGVVAYASVFSAQCVKPPSSAGEIGDWDRNIDIETWSQSAKTPDASDEVWIDSGYYVRIFDGSHTLSKLEMRAGESGANLEISGGCLEITGIAKFEGTGNSIVVSGGNLTIYWAYGGIDGLRISSGSFEIENGNWDTILNLSQSGGEVILHSLDLQGPGAYVFEPKSTGVLKVETDTTPTEFFADHIDSEILKDPADKWVYGSESINSATYATLSVGN
jgi:hypothetical protein